MRRCTATNNPVHIVLDYAGNMSTSLRNRFDKSIGKGVVELTGGGDASKPSDPTNGTSKDSSAPAKSGGLSFDLEQVAQIQEKAEAFYNAALKIIEKAEPYIKIATDYGEKVWAIIEPYNPQELGTALYGLILVFFGGYVKASHLVHVDYVQLPPLTAFITAL